METIMGICPECGGFIMCDESIDSWYCDTCDFSSEPVEEKPLIRVLVDKLDKKGNGFIIGLTKDENVIISYYQGYCCIDSTILYDETTSNLIKELNKI